MFAVHVYIFKELFTNEVHGIFIDLGGDWGMAMTCDNERCSKSYVQRKKYKKGAEQPTAKISGMRRCHGGESIIC